MMAYLKEIPTRTCQQCMKRAKTVLYNWQNAEMAFYCARCGKAALIKLQAAERRGA